MPVAPGPAASRLVDALLARRPAHARFLSRRFQDLTPDEGRQCDELARQITTLAGDDLDVFLDGYDFICRIQTEEELHFRRHKAYRLTSFGEAMAQVYSDPDYMAAYLRGLLMTQLFWSNHTRSIAFYTERFLPGLPADADLLEIGPGHGLLMARAVQRLGPGRATGWDVSESSLDQTRHALAALAVDEGVVLHRRNLFDAHHERFDAVVFSEVLEHLEDPQGALAAIRGLLRPGGRLYLNVPVNSPAPDHIFLLRSPQEVFDLVQAQGFRILDRDGFPATNYTLEQAVKHDLTISVALIATPD